MSNRILAALTLLALAAGPVTAVEINYTSPAFEIGVTSTGASLTSGFTFSIGSFGSFTPTAGNTSQWLANFASLGSIAWDTDLTQYSNTVTLSGNGVAFDTNTQAYVWGYDFTSGSSGQWILLTNANWKFPTSTNLLPTEWDASDAGTYAVVGTIASTLGANPYLQTQAVNPTAVPEPAAVAALLGFAAIGLVVRRRQLRRAAAQSFPR